MKVLDKLPKFIIWSEKQSCWVGMSPAFNTSTPQCYQADPFDAFRELCELTDLKLKVAAANGAHLPDSNMFIFENYQTKIDGYDTVKDLQSQVEELKKLLEKHKIPFDT